MADRFIEVTKTVAKRSMKEQVLDQMELERERGITIKLQPVKMRYRDYELNLIDTPGHVDFSYEVSRSLAAVEGAVLLIDATQGIEAQTLANLYLALDQDLAIIPVINKIDLPNANVDKTAQDIMSLIGCAREDIIAVSAKTGEHVTEVLDAVIKQVQPPAGQEQDPLRMLIFDSVYDEYRGVIAYVRVVSGSLQSQERIEFMATQKQTDVLEVGNFHPQLIASEEISAGDIGYVVTGLKDVNYCRVGDTITSAKKTAAKPLSGYKTLKPMVFAGVYCKEGDDYPDLRDAIEKISLNDASLFYEPEQSEALGFGFRCGFLGVLHLEIFQERLKREYDLALIITAPSVGYQVTLNEAGQKAQERKDKKHGAAATLHITSPHQLPKPSYIESIEEPWARIDIITPSDYIGEAMTLVQEKRGEYRTTEYLDEHKVVLHYEMPLASIIVDFYDTLKSVSAGFASMNYEVIGYRTCNVARLDILVAEETVEALSTIVYTDEAYVVARKIVDTLKEALPRQQFELKIQAAIGAKIIASGRIPPLRKDVTANLYGGDVTRKRKLLEKQKKGKKRMRSHGRVDIPQEAFLAVLKR